MNYRYVLTETTYYDGEPLKRDYGVASISTLDGITVLEEITSILDDRAAIEELIGLCNDEELDIIHLKDVVYDYIRRVKK